MLPLLFDCTAECHYFSFPCLCRGSWSPLHHFCKAPGCSLGRVNTPAGWQPRSLGGSTEEQSDVTRGGSGSSWSPNRTGGCPLLPYIPLFQLNDLSLEFREIKRSEMSGLVDAFELILAVWMKCKINEWWNVSNTWEKCSWWVYPSNYLLLTKDPTMFYVLCLVVSMKWQRSMEISKAIFHGGMVWCAKGVQKLCFTVCHQWTDVS